MTWSGLIWIVVFGLIFVGSLILSLRLHGGVATPLFFFSGGYCISVVLYHLRLLHYPSVSIATHLIVILSLAAFTLGALLGSARPVDTRRNPDANGLAVFFYTTAVLATVGWVLPLAIILTRYGPGHLMVNMWILEYEFQMQFIGYLNLLGILVFPTFLIKRSRIGARWLDRILVPLSFVGLILAGNKTYLVFALFGGVMAHSVESPWSVKIRHLMVLGAAVLAFFVGYNQLIDVGAPKFPASRIPDPLAFLERPYHYFTGALPAMEQVVRGNMPPRPVPGFVTLQPFWKLFGGLMGLVGPVPKNLPDVAIGPYAFNVYSFAGEVCWDWGPAGVAALSLLLGWSLTALYRRAGAAGLWMNTLLYAVCGYGAVIAFFAYYYGFNMFFLVGYVLVAGSATHWASSRPPRPTPDSPR